MMKRIFLLVAALAVWTYTSAQALYQLDTNNVTIGDQVTLSISGVENYRTLEELNQNGVVALKQWEDTVKHIQYTTLTSFDEGDHSIMLGAEDSLVLVVNDVEGVDTVNVQIKDIAPIIKVRYTFWEIFRWILLGLAIVALIVAIVFVVKRLKAHKPIIELHPEPVIPPDERALKSLEELRRKELWQAGKVKEYYTDLTDIVRNYLEEAWNINSTDMTSDETLEAYHDSHAYDETCESKLRQMLRTADMVKFAKGEPLPNEHTQAMSHAVEFVDALAEKNRQQAVNGQQSVHNS
jgi:hypothetical protein